MVNKVVIMSGIPGSGKTTYINTILNNLSIFSADYYHITADGRYVFDPKNIKAAHDWCLRDFLNTIQHLQLVDKSHTIAVDNTNLMVWEIAPYYRIAECMGIDVEIVRIWCDPLIAAKRNVHNVPIDRVFAMYQTMLREVFPPHWKTQTVIV